MTTRRCPVMRPSGWNGDHLHLRRCTLDVWHGGKHEFEDVCACESEATA
jgi:hypothetical protein